MEKSSTPSSENSNGTILLADLDHFLSSDGTLCPRLIQNLATQRMQSVLGLSPDTYTVSDIAEYLSGQHATNDDRYSEAAREFCHELYPFSWACVGERAARVLNGAFSNSRGQKLCPQIHGWVKFLLEN